MTLPMESMYREIILDHYKHPQHNGLPETFEVEVHHVNPTCGDEITLRVHVNGDHVADVSYDAVGCSISQASASVLNDLVVGKSVTDGLAVLDQFHELMQGKGQVVPDEDEPLVQLYAEGETEELTAELADEITVFVDAVVQGDAVEQRTLEQASS